MKTMAETISLLAILGILSATTALAQRGPGGGGGGGGPENRWNRLYQPQTVETIKGEVLKVETVPSPRGMGQGVHLLVKTDQETLPVHLGPAWFIDNQEIQIQPKDQVQITGSRVTFEGKPALLAAEVQDRNATLKLRDESGIPVWAGWRQGAAGAAGGPGGRMMGAGGMGTNMMARHQEMMAEHQKMMSEMKAMDADLDQKVAQMNQAQGNAKMDAMAAVINDLVKERRVMRQHMEEMHQRMMSHMHSMPPGAMGGSQSGTSDGSSEGGTSSGKR